MSDETKKPKYRRNTRRNELIKAAVIVVLIGLVLRIFVFMPFRESSKDMEGTLMQGDFLLTSQLSYSTGKPQVGDLIVFQHPFKIDELTAGRVIALEGQTVEIIDKEVYVDDEHQPNPDRVRFTDHRIISQDFANRDNIIPVQVPAGAVYVLCDNRDEGEDSRRFGPITHDAIKGKGLFVYWSWKPDPNAPKMESPYITPAISILFYNLFHFPSRIGWNRIGAGI